MSIWSFVEDLLLFRIFRKIFRGDARQADNGISTPAYRGFEPHHINQAKDRMDYLMSEADEYDESNIDELEDKIAELEDLMSECNSDSRQYSLLEDELSLLQDRLDRIEDNCDIYGFPKDDMLMDDYSSDDFYYGSNSDSLPGGDFYDDPGNDFDDDW